MHIMIDSNRQKERGREIWSHFAQCSHGFVEIVCVCDMKNDECETPNLKKAMTKKAEQQHQQQHSV